MLSYNLACCSLKHEAGKLIVQRAEKMYKHKVRSVRELGRRFKGPLWGHCTLTLPLPLPLPLPLSLTRTLT